MKMIAVTILVAFTIVLIAFLPKERSKRVHDFVRMLLSLLPISKVVKAVAEKTKK